MTTDWFETIFVRQYRSYFSVAVVKSARKFIKKRVDFHLQCGSVRVCVGREGMAATVGLGFRSRMRNPCREHNWKWSEALASSFNQAFCVMILRMNNHTPVCRIESKKVPASLTTEDGKFTVTTGSVVFNKILIIEKSEGEIQNLFWQGTFVLMLRKFYRGKPKFSKKKY